MTGTSFCLGKRQPDHLQRSEAGFCQQETWDNPLRKVHQQLQHAATASHLACHFEKMGRF